MNDSRTLFVLGGSGFIGTALIREATALGWQTKALVRSDAAADQVRRAGAVAVVGDAREPDRWVSQLESSRCVVDLLQPARSKRITRRDMRRMSQERQAFTRALLAALGTIDENRRPRLISVSGIDDLSLDRDGALSSTSPLAQRECGFNSIGIPVRTLIEASNVRAAFVYLGVVYGPGGAFGREIFPAVRAGSWKVFGDASRRMLIVHVADAVRGLLAVAESPSRGATPAAFVFVDDVPVSMRDFFGLAASTMGVRAPGSVPAWMASLVAGRPVVETMLHRESARSDFDALSVPLRFPSYREGVPASLAALAGR